ncbi:unnamed protein product, partial [Closterium sp. NIES-54]
MSNVGVLSQEGRFWRWPEAAAAASERDPYAPTASSGVDIFALDYDAILAAMYALTVSAEGAYYLCVPPDPGIEAAALGASESALPGEALHTFTLDSGDSRCFFRDSTTLTLLPAPVPVRLADPSGGPVLARSSAILPCPAVPSGSLSSPHLPSFSTNLVSTADLQDAIVTTTTPEGQRMLNCTSTRTGRHLATFTRRPGSSLYTLTVEPALVAASGSGVRVRSLPPLPPSPAPPCLPCVEGRQRAAPHSSSFPPTTAPVQTLHMDVWGEARVSEHDREHYFLLVVDDYTRYTTVFPLRSKGEWFREDLPVLRLHSDRVGEFSSDLLRDFCHGEGILQSFMIPASPQKNRVAERRIGLVMEVARTSMIHAAAPHFLWPYAVRYAAHQLNLWPVSPCRRPRLHCVGRETLAMHRCSRSRALVPLSAILPLTSSPPALFPASSLAFPLTRLGGSFTTPPRAMSCPLRTSCLMSRFPFTVSSPTALPLSPPPPLPLFLAPGPPPVDPLPPQGPALSGVSQVDPLPLAEPVEVTVDSDAAGGGAARGASCR